MLFYALKFNPEGHGTEGDDEVVFSPTLSVSLGSSTIDWLFEFRIKLDALPTVAGTYYFIGSDTTSAEGIYLRLNAGIYTLAFAVSASLRFQSSADMILADGEFHTYKISRLRNQLNVVFERDGVPFGAPTSMGNTSTAVMDLNRFGRGATNATNFTSFELDYFICSTSAGLYAEWRADLSNGSGTKLLTTDGSRDGDLLNFTSGAEWVLYDENSVTPVAFTGPVTDKFASVSTLVYIDLSSLFSGTETPFTYSIASGSLPAGLTLTSDGFITGIPTATGSSSVSVRATDTALNTTVTNSFSFVVIAPIKNVWRQFPAGNIRTINLIEPSEVKWIASGFWEVQPSIGGIPALILVGGEVHQITQAQVGTGRKPLVLFNGGIKERTTSEGIPIVYDSGGLRTLAAGETLLL